MQHDAAFVHKGLDDFILPYIQRVAPSVNTVQVRSDGCKAKFKCAANFDWVSCQTSEGCGLKIEWPFFESCHGKCYCDPEGGTIKNGGRQRELNLTDKSDQLKESENFYDWARHNKSGLGQPKLSLAEKRRRGILRRFFY